MEVVTGAAININPSNNCEASANSYLADLQADIDELGNGCSAYRKRSGGDFRLKKRDIV